MKLIKTTLIGWFLLFFVAEGQAQNAIKLSGRVIADDLLPLVNAGIYISQFSLGTFSDSAGNFQLSLKPGYNEISFSYIGFNSETVKLFITRDTSIEVKLKTNLQLGEVTIVDRKQMLNALHEANGTITLTRQNFNSLPAFLGENDPMRAVQMQPGVQSGNEGARGIFIRGGSPDQNLMLIDGAAVYNPSHIYGFISVFNGDAIHHLDVYKDHYPARFGGRLCSVIDINMSEGDTTKFHGTFSFGLIASRLHLEGPVTKKKKTTFSFSTRGCYIGLYTSPISKKQYAATGFNGDIYYYFGDVNAKIVHRFSAKTKAELTFFTNNDYYSFKRESNTENDVFKETSSTQQSIHWANYVVSANLIHEFDAQWSMKQHVSFSRYEIANHNQDRYGQVNYSHGSSEYYNNFNSENKSYINDYSWREDATYQTVLQTFMMGAGVTGLFFETGKGKSTRDDSFNGKRVNELQGTPIKSLDAFVYAEDEYHPDEHWLINGGFHTRIYNVQQKTFVSFLPRVNVLYNPVAKFYLRASASGLSQNLHLLATASSNILNDYWVPATASAKPENGWNFSSGMTQKLPLNFEWSIDGFYRTMNNVIEDKYDSQRSLINRSWDEQVVMGGKGRSYGAEFYVARSAGRITGSVAYTLSWSQRKFASLNEGKYYPYKYDRRHNLSAQLTFLVGKHIELGTSYVYGSGNMFTLPLQSYNSWAAAFFHDLDVQNGYTQPVSGEEITVYTGKNNYRLPAYHHLDLSFTYRKRVKTLEHLFNFSIYNVYSRANIFSIYSDFRTDANGNRIQVYKQLSLFPILPSLSYTIKFGA